MRVKLKKTFIKDLRKLSGQPRKEIEIFVFETAPHIPSLAETPNLRRIKGHPRFYRVRFGPYRVGFEQRDGAIIFYRVLHRKDIYRYFP
ncbi:MAG: type II toxin-antitoxin system RelE/ParE family toxin [Kiritimatiellae bacterium]|nr:type II toxin-antitoxin system RelE/ParE family toxin [Kiritimatiellia bacterium]